MVKGSSVWGRKVDNITQLKKIQGVPRELIKSFSFVLCLCDIPETLEGV